MEAEKMIDLIIEAEGGYVNDPNDRGGATKYGITQSTLNAYTDSMSLKRVKARDLSLSMARSIYRDRYLAPCITANDAVTLLVFDWGVNSGVRTAIKGLQKIIGVEEDGIIGNITNEAIRSYFSFTVDISGAMAPASKAQKIAISEKINVLVAKLIDARHCFYAGIVSRNPSQARFILGWARRVSKLLKVIEAENLAYSWTVDLLPDSIKSVRVPQ